MREDFVGAVGLNKLARFRLDPRDERDDAAFYELVGDENLSWKAYLELFFEAVGNPQDLPVSEEEHPLFPDVILYAGRNAVISYEPENGELGYSRNNVRTAVRELVEAYG